MAVPNWDIVSGGSIAEAAQAYAVAGFRVIPIYGLDENGACRCRRVGCAGPGTSAGKHPMMLKWQELATTDVSTVNVWFGSQFRGASVGLAMGGPRRLVAIDLDGTPGEEEWARLVAKHGEPPPTMGSRSGSGVGRHKVYCWPAGVALPRNKVRLCPGIDIRSEGGQIVVAPSPHASGFSYSWLDKYEPAEAPAWLVELAAKAKEPLRVVEPPRPSRPASPPPVGRSAYVQKAFDDEIANVRGASEGTRNNALNLAAYYLGKFVGGGVLRESEVFDELLAAAKHVGLTQGEAEPTIASGIAAGKAKPRTAPEPQRHQQSEPRQRVAPEAETPADDTEAFDDEPPEGGEPAPPVSETPSILQPMRGVDIFAELPPVQWLVEGLKLAPGRPALWCGYGFSGKTVSVQALVLAVCAGAPVWGEYPCRQGGVLHLDYDQGRNLSRRRYQRLAKGHGIDPAAVMGSLHLECFPRLFLDEAVTEDEITRYIVKHGIVLVVVDAYVGALGDTDENAAEAGRPLYMLARIADRTGATFIVVHHARKPQAVEIDHDPVGGARMAIRGSGAIYGASDGVFVLGGAKGDPVLVKHEKEPVEGKLLDDFTLNFEDIEIAGDAKAGLRVSLSKVPDDEGIFSGDAALAKAKRSALETLVRNHDIRTKSELANRMCGKRDVKFKAISELMGKHRRLIVEHEGRLRLASEVAS